MSTWRAALIDDKYSRNDASHLDLRCGMQTDGVSSMGVARPEVYCAHATTVFSS